MAIGNVGKSGRERKDVAPNSPSDMVNEKIAPTRPALAKMGRSISDQTLLGFAPNSAAAWRSTGGMEDNAGRSVRNTNGNATRLCANGMSSGNEDASNGGRLKTTMKPNPRVTAEVPSGSMITGSINGINPAFTCQSIGCKKT